MHMRPISITCKMVQILVVYVERSNLDVTVQEVLKIGRTTG